MPNSYVLTSLMWIRRAKNHPLTALTAGLLVGAALSSLTLRADASDFGVSAPLPSSSPRPSTSFGVFNSVPTNDDEVSPDDFAKEFGLPLSDDQPLQEGHGFSKSIPATRVVSPEHFGDFRVNVDIFRRSTRRPVLGDFRDEYTETLVPNAGGMTPEARTAEARKRFANLAGREFAVASLDGVPFKAYLISAAIEQRVAVVVRDAEGNIVRDPATGRPVTRMSMKTTPPGNFRLDPIAYDKKFRLADGTAKVVPVAFPWIRSQAYNNSQMYWGLWIRGGYFIHSTPHYGELGHPASMGCIRQSFPDAQELFKLLVEQNMSGMIRIHPMGAEASVSRLREIIVDLGYAAPVAGSPKDPSKDMNWVLGQLQANYQNIRDTIRYYDTSELEIAGHSWIDETSGKPAATTWPTCGDLNGSPIDCFKTWTVRKPRNSTN